ncbi:MAG: hypothetical protein K6U87_13265 [Firmicutes bacterium]|nr:hypothetical protein [Bacillota bacterium]
MRAAIWGWLLTVFLVYFLYVGASTLWFNYVSPFILGMPPIVFWFTLVPIVAPGILALLYWYDRRVNPQWEKEGSWDV